jgi:hypothetical protein
MALIGFNQNWTIHREGCKDAVDLDVVGEFESVSDFRDHLIQTKHTFAEENQPDELTKWIKHYLKPCTGIS